MGTILSAKQYVHLILYPDTTHFFDSFYNTIPSALNSTTNIQFSFQIITISNGHDAGLQETQVDAEFWHTCKSKKFGPILAITTTPLKYFEREHRRFGSDLYSDGEQAKDILGKHSLIGDCFDVFQDHMLMFNRCYHVNSAPSFPEHTAEALQNYTVTGIQTTLNGLNKLTRQYHCWLELHHLYPEHYIIFTGYCMCYFKAKGLALMLISYKKDSCITYSENK